MTTTYVPPMMTYHCSACDVEWKALKAEPCWLCKEASACSPGPCRDYRGQAILFNSTAMVPVRESADDPL